MAAPVPEVIDADEWYLDGQRYPLASPIQITGLSVLPGRITIGANDRDQEQIRSTWILEDWAGGLGIVDMDESTDSDRFAWATMDTRRRRTISRLPLATALNTGAPANTRLRTGWAWGTTLFGAWDNHIRYRAAGTNTWATPSEPSYAPLAANATDTLLIRLDGTNYLIFVDGAGLLYYTDATNWGAQAGNGTTVPAARLLAEWDGKLYILDSNNLLWMTADLVTFTQKAPIPVPTGEVVRLLVYFDADEHPILHASTHDGLWLYNADVSPDGQWYRTRLDFPRYPTAGAVAQWRGDLFEASALDVYHFTGRVISPVGLSRDDGIPKDWQGDIVYLLGSHNWLIAGMSANEAVGGLTDVQTTVGPWRVRIIARAASRSALFAWTGAAWHMLWNATSTGTGIDWIGTWNVSGDRKLVWGSNGTAYFQDLPLGVFNPREDPTWAYETSGELISPWFDGNKAEVEKLAIDFDAALKDASATATGEFFYGIDGDASWTLIRTQTEDRPDPTPFGPDAEGVVFHKIRFRVVLTAADPATPLEVDFMVLTYLPQLERLYGITATIDLADRQTSRALERTLQATLAKRTLLQSNFRRQGQDVGPPGRVFVARYQALSNTGANTQGKHTLQVIGV